MSNRAYLFLHKQCVRPLKSYFLTFLGLVLAVSLHSQTVIAVQDFDGGTPAWNFSSDVPFFDNGTDGYFGVNTSFAPLDYVNLSGSVLYENDLDDEGDNGTTGFANVTFDPIDVSGFNSVVFTFDYDIEGYNAANDEAHYEMFYDGVGQGQVTLHDGENGFDDSEGTVTENVPNGTGMVSVVLSIRNNGASGFSAYDNFELEGVASGGATEVVFALSATDVDESAGIATLCVNMLNGPVVGAAVTVDVAATGGTAVNPDDYIFTTQTLTFPDGDDSPQCFDVTIVDDMIIDEGETIEFTLQNAMGAAIGATSTLTVTILDDDKLTCTEPVWNVVSPIDNEVWTPITGGYEANGFCGGGCTQDVETWLVFGPFDMTGVGLLELEFNASEGFGITDLNVQYSTDAGSNACPDEVTWTSVGTVDVSGDYSFDFSAATGTAVFIGIEYSDDGADGYSAWDLTNFVLLADVCPTVGDITPPMVDAGADVVQCGVAAVGLNATGDGMWTGGAGSFDDATSPTATYTPDASEEGTTVVLTYTLNLPSCTGFSDDVSLTFFEEPADTEFSYGMTEICPGDGILSVMHTTGVDGMYSVTMGDETMIDLDPTNGDIDLGNTADGTYEITNTIPGCGNIMITGVIDGPLTGGQPKAIELYAIDDIPDLSVYGIGSANNGNGGGVIEFTFPADAIAAGTFFYVADNNTDFNSFFGFDADYVNGAANINGDDAIEVFCNGSVIDVFGDINMDGSGEPWEYLDGWVYRMNDTGPNAGGFVVGDFSYSGINALDGESSNGTAATPFPVGSFTTTQTGICPNSSTSVTVIIGDNEGPEVDCPNDINIQLETGECEEIAFYEITFTDNCGSIDAEMSQLVNDMLVSTALDCINNTSNHLRYFTNTLPVPVEITQVNFGVFAAGTNETVTVNVYAIDPGAPFQYANMVLVGSADYMVPSGMNNSIFTAMVDATIPVGMDYVLELKANNTTNFVIGYNTAGETGSTYISGNNPVPCVSLEPTDIDGLGFPTFAVVLYSNAEAGPAIEQNVWTSFW